MRTAIIHPRSLPRKGFPVLAPLPPHRDSHKARWSGGFPPLHPLKRLTSLTLEHDPGLRGLGALLDAHKVDARRSRTAAVILAVPPDLVGARGRKLFAKRPDELPVDRVDPDLDGTAVAERVLDVRLELERIARNGGRAADPDLVMS